MTYLQPRKSVAEMFQSEIHPLPFDHIEFVLSKWSQSRNEIESWKEVTSLSGFVLELKRDPIPFLTNTYFPTGLLTMISFIGFVIPVDIVPGRMALLVTIFLMLVNMSTNERSRGPEVRIGSLLFTHV